MDPVLDGNKLKCINNISASLAALGDFLDVKHIGPQNLYDQIYASVMGIVWKIIEFFHTEVPIREMLSDMHDPIDPVWLSFSFSFFLFSIFFSLLKNNLHFFFNSIQNRV